MRLVFLLLLVSGQVYADRVIYGPATAGGTSSNFFLDGKNDHRAVVYSSENSAANGTPCLETTEEADIEVKAGTGWVKTGDSLTASIPAGIIEGSGTYRLNVDASSEDCTFYVSMPSDP